MGAERDEKKPLPGGRERLRKDTSKIILQLSTEQFEGKEKASSQSNANQSEKLTICHEASPPFVL